MKRTIGFTIAAVILFTLLTALLIHYALNSQERLYIDVSNKVVQRIQTVKQEQQVKTDRVSMLETARASDIRDPASQFGFYMADNQH